MNLRRLSIKSLGYHFSRSHSSGAYPNEAAVDAWIATPKELVIEDTLHVERVLDLYCTLPTRDGTSGQVIRPRKSIKLGYGHHLAFFHHRTPEPSLRRDGTDGEFAPPEPYTRRMWAGGTIKWDNRNPLLIGESVVAKSTVTSIKKKGSEKGSPMLFLTQSILYSMVGKSSPSVVEERTHVYLPGTPVTRREVVAVKDIPSEKGFSFQYTPSLTTLFRYSALMFNGHHIHLDKDYAQKEGYPERLVHGPLTALMLLETIVKRNPGVQLTRFDYRARNPVIVNQPQTLYGSWEGSSEATLWCESDDGVVGMTGSVLTE